MSAQDLDALRHDVVTCTRLLVYCGILDYSGHVSARVPGTDLFLIQPRDMSRAALSPRDLLTVDLDGEVHEGDSPPPSETAIHAGVYRARADANMICHGHPTLSTTFSMVDQPLRPMRHFAYKFPAGLPVHPDPTHIYSREQADAVARTLGDGGACLLRSHGTVVVADNFPVLFMDCLDIEENARTLLYASQLGNLNPLTPDEIDRIRESYGRSGHRPKKLWEHYLHKGRAAGIL